NETVSYVNRLSKKRKNCQRSLKSLRMIHRISTRLFFNFKSYVDQSECIYASYNVRDIFITKNEYSNDSLLILSVAGTSVLCNLPYT
ncbi:MAG: hypothetical protein WCE96_07095, partial [Nitrososphaeraceae archaeon]